MFTHKISLLLSCSHFICKSWSKFEKKRGKFLFVVENKSLLRPMAVQCVNNNKMKIALIHLVCIVFNEIKLTIYEYIRTQQPN